MPIGIISAGTLGTFVPVLGNFIPYGGTLFPTCSVTRYRYTGTIALEFGSNWICKHQYKQATVTRVQLYQGGKVPCKSRYLPGYQ
jgi:hypothetical protein